MTGFSPRDQEKELDKKFQFSLKKNNFIYFLNEGQDDAFNDYKF